MLKFLRLVDWKSFDKQTAELDKLSLLVGPNASGKSNLLDAIRFLQGLGLGLSIEDIFRGRTEGGRVVWPRIRGGLTEAARLGARQFTVESTWILGDGEEYEVLTHRIDCQVQPDPLVERESLSKPSDVVLFDTHTPTLGSSSGRYQGNLNVALLRRPGRKGKAPSKAFPATRSLLGQIKPASDIDPRVSSLCQKIQDAMRSTLFLEIMPSRMRDYVPQSATDIGLNGENISAVLYQLCQDAEKKQDLIDWLSELCAPELADIDFVKTELGDVMLVLVEKGGGRLSARSLSDGTLRFLGELVAMLTALPGSVLVMEEIENGLHPARANLLVQEMESATRPGRCQILATTHSPLILQSLSPERLGEAIVFGRPPDAQGTVMKRLKDLPHFQEIVERRGIENLFTTKWLERAL